MSSSYNVNGFNPDPQAWAAAYLTQGWQPVRIPRRDGRPTKAPSDLGWNKRPYTKDDFIVDDNVGLKLGVASHGLADVDLDSFEAVAAAPYFLPETGLIGGHERRPRSHYFYQTTSDNGDIAPAVKPEQLTYTIQKDQTTVIELRGDGQQTLVAPSTHPDGGVYHWDQFAAPARVSYAQLRRAVVLTAMAATLAAYWPSPGRHNAGLSIAGLLYTCEVNEVDAARLVEVAATIAGHQRVPDRVNCVTDTYQKGRNGDKIKGIPSLAQVFPDPVVAALKKWCKSIAPEKREWGNGHTDGSGFADDARDLQAEEARLFRPYTIEEFLALDIKPREHLIEPWLSVKGLCMVHAWRGVGKTYFTLGAAYAIATGEDFLAWKVPKPHKVLYIDGEMPAGILQSRLAEIVNGAAKEPPSADHFQVLSADIFPEGIPDLSTEDGQKIVGPFIDGVDLVVLDNLSTLARSGEENAAEAWLPIQQWVLSLRRRGVAVLLVHHSGKTGLQRGSSRREDVLDTVIHLKHPSDYKFSDGCRFEVHFEKARGFHGAAAEPIDVQYSTEQGKEGAPCLWTFKKTSEALTDRIVELHAQEFSYAAIAEKLGVSKSTVSRHIGEAKKTGKVK